MNGASKFFEQCDLHEFMTNAGMGTVISMSLVEFGGKPRNKTTVIGFERGVVSQCFAAGVVGGLWGRGIWEIFGFPSRIAKNVNVFAGAAVGVFLFTTMFSPNRIHVRTFDR